MNNNTQINTNNSYINNNDNFAKLYNLTQDVCGKDQLSKVKFSSDKNVWIQLASVWDTSLKDRSVGLFTDAVHRIMWGVPIKDSIPEYDGIVQIIMEELLADGDAFEAWDTYEPCKIAMSHIENDMNPCVEDNEHYRYSIEHYIYVRDKMMWKICYSKKKYISQSESVTCYIKAYEDAIKKIVPIAVTWSDDKWLDESNIHDEIIKLYGVDYRDNYIDYGRVLLLLMNNKKGKIKRKNYDAWCLSNITELPYSLAQALWPTDTENNILELMTLALKKANSPRGSEATYAKRKANYLHPFGVFEHSALIASGAYKLLTQWAYATRYSDEFKLKAKQVAFNIMATSRSV